MPVLNYAIKKFYLLTNAIVFLFVLDGVSKKLAVDMMQGKVKSLRKKFEIASPDKDIEMLV